MIIMRKWSHLVECTIINTRVSVEILDKNILLYICKYETYRIKADRQWKCHSKFTTHFIVLICPIIFVRLCDYFFQYFSIKSADVSINNMPCCGCMTPIQTKSTPRAQTSTTSSLKSVKQFTQALNSVTYCFLCPYSENFMNVHPSGIPWCCQQTRTQKIEKGTLCPRD